MDKKEKEKLEKAKELIDDVLESTKDGNGKPPPPPPPGDDD